MKNTKRKNNNITKMFEYIFTTLVWNTIWAGIDRE